MRFIDNSVGAYFFGSLCNAVWLCSGQFYCKFDIIGMCNAVLSNIDDADAIQKFIFTTTATTRPGLPPLLLRSVVKVGERRRLMHCVFTPYSVC